MQLVSCTNGPCEQIYSRENNSLHMYPPTPALTTSHHLKAWGQKDKHSVKDHPGSLALPLLRTSFLNGYLGDLNMSFVLQPTVVKLWPTLSALLVRLWASFLLVLYGNSPHSLLPFILVPILRMDLLVLWGGVVFCNSEWITSDLQAFETTLEGRLASGLSTRKKTQGQPTF